MSMNIYQKLAEARVRFQSANVKQSGQNKFAGYSYYELSDILPIINNLGKELGFICVVSFDDDKACLRVVSTEDAQQSISFYSPMSTASLKGCHEVQNLGAVQTYIKRYLYQNAFEIVEHDALNGTHNPDEKPETKQERQAVISNQARDIAERIRKADADQLAEIGNELKGLQLADYDKKVLRQEYAMRTKELAPPAE